MLSIISVTLFGMPKGMLPTGSVRKITDRSMMAPPKQVLAASQARTDNANEKYIGALTFPMTADELGCLTGSGRGAAYSWCRKNEKAGVLKRIGDKRPFKWEVKK